MICWVIKRGLKTLLYGLLFLTFACSPVITASPPPSPQAVTVEFPPSLKLVDEALSSCAQANPSLALLVSEIPATNSVDSDSDLTLWLGEPPESAGFSAPLAVEEIVFVVHPENPVRALSIEEVASLLGGETGNWDQLVEMEEQVNVWSYPYGNDIQQVVTAEILRTGSITPSSYLAPDPAAMIEAVSADPGAIGFLPGAWLTDSVATVEITGEGDYDLHRPVLVLAEQSPTGVVRTLLVCLQSPTGQNVLERHYEPWID